MKYSMTMCVRGEKKKPKWDQYSKENNLIFIIALIFGCGNRPKVRPKKRKKVFFL